MNTRGTLTFLAENSPPPVYRPSVGGAEARLDVSGAYENREIDILDARIRPESFSLDQHGFELQPHDSAVTNVYDSDQRSGPYEAECRQIVALATGATRTECFDHTLRSGDADTREEKKLREPTTVIHNDYTPRSGPQRVLDLMGDEAEILLAKPFAIINVWRPIKPIESFPLTVCDARTLRPESLVAAERRAKNRIGELYMVRFDPEQRWVYFPDMSTNEVLLIKTYDSREDGRARWCVHTALDDRDSNPNAPPRNSIETRVFAFFDA
jgi:hypothetical protein